MLDRVFLKSCLVFIALLGMPGLAMAAGKCERLVATGHPDYPPFSWRDPQNPQRLIGAQADLLARLGKELGVRIEMLYSRSWDKAQEEVRSGRVDLLAGAALTLADLETMDYVYPAVFSRAKVVWVRSVASFPYIEWADLRERRGAMVSSDFGLAFDEFAKANLSLEQGASLTQLFQKLMLGEVDYVLHEREPGQALAYTLGLQDDLLALSPPIASEGLYLSLSHNSACNDPWLRGQLAKKMTELAAAGLPEDLLQRNLLRWKEQRLRPASASNQ
ncbi:amino acid ABC transporter substrate-binding protein (PAAT family) [Pseudomonas sp. SJZ079]|uniref:substrate-binding periplasmic protein n=1 Tax=Pseudomonas sp. SJZ079 TaxID=2572887 RepID=UPI001198E280|nr:transporter substrate-binding domain-containing protein [Pseudomonas sp. SJZ079]TWC39037.1 amino acid ABC transporter substrate-binding protein (PAAT family) [Pseudomonas sp. SJZ079]